MARMLAAWVLFFWGGAVLGGAAEIAGQAEMGKKMADGDGKILVAVDAGHQQAGNPEKEPVGPGATEMKAKVSPGTRGAATGRPEYVLNLELALRLRDELRKRGYAVLMTRETHDVNLSNRERAEMANAARAAAFIRIHADGSEKEAENGATTLCQTPKNPYNARLYPESKKLSLCVLEKMTATAGCKKRGVWETDTMSGINWCQVPVTIVEVGFMTNRAEDEKLATPEYQAKIVSGIADGVDAFFWK